MLCAAGIPIKTENWIGKMHNKAMVIDPTGADPVVITGSMNWTGAGNDDNDENTLIIHDGTTAQSYQAAFDTLYNALPAETACVNETLTQTVSLPLMLGGAGDATTGPSIDLDLIMYNPDGSDVDGEYVKIDNNGDAAQEMAGWTLTDVANNRFTFPSFTLNAGSSVYVWVGTGTSDTTNLFWGRGSSVWNNSGDTATLKDDQGATIDSCSYDGGEEAHFCE